MTSGGRTPTPAGSGPARPQPERWTAVIPAAGRGSRLGSALPKLLYPVAGRPILDWLLDLCAGLCGRYVFVLSPQGAGPVGEVLAKGLPGRHAIVIQEEPLGMAPAVQLGLERVESELAFVLWGDQVSLRRQTLAQAMASHQKRPGAVLTLPTVRRQAPYIHIQRDQEGRITQVLQAREGDAMPPRGESDCGLFLLHAAKVRQALARHLAGDDLRGRLTGESNFLALIPLLEREYGGVATLPICGQEETLGVNTPEDAQQAARLLTRRSRAGED